MKSYPWGHIALLLLISLRLQSQVSLTGSVLDAQSQPVSFANALLLSATDSSLVKGAITDDQGIFTLTTDQPGLYLIRVAMIGYRDYYSAPLEAAAGDAARDLGIITLREDAILMKTVEVVARKPFLEQRIDRMVVNVANSITSAGTNALEILQRSPGVLVNRQNNLISIAGKNGVVVMINGRINYMPPEAVVQMLESMSSDNIDHIEIITTPPAGFDAEGNAGYINIVLRKSLDDGFNGSYSFSLGVGKGLTGNAGINFNLRKGKANLYGDYSYLHESQEQVFDFYRRIRFDGSPLETDTKSIRDPERNNHTVRLGYDYQVTPKTVIGALVSAYNTKWVMDAFNTSRISGDAIVDTNIVIDNTELNQWKHAGGNLNLQHTFSENRKLTIDLDMLWYQDNNPTSYHNRYSDETGMMLFETFTRSTKITPFRIKAGKIDYTTGLGKRIRIETGIKATTSHFTNDVGVLYLESQGWTPDPGLTAKYDLDERILAGYVSMESPLGRGFTFKGGLRYEYSDSHLSSAEQPDIVDRQFGELFPSAYLSKEFKEGYSLTASYSKRITRPTFNDMAPFTIFLDPYTFFSGNPALQPALTHKVGLNLRVKSFSCSLEYAFEDSTIAQFQSSILPGTNTQLLFAENFKDGRGWAVNFSLPVQPTKWWNLFLNINGNYQRLRRYYIGQLDSYSSGGFGFFSSQTFTLPWNMTFEANGFYNAGGLFGAIQVSSVWSVNLGLQKKFGDTGGALRIGYDDLFDSQVFSGISDLSEQDQYFSAKLKFSQPQFKIGYTRNFGGQQVKARRERGTGTDEERQRIGN